MAMIWKEFGAWIWQSLVGLAEIADVATFLVVAVAVFTFRQKLNSDNREAWWKRVEWAIESALSEEQHEQRRAAGTAAILDLKFSKLAKKVDRKFLEAIASAILDKLLEDDVITLRQDDDASVQADGSGKSARRTKEDIA